MAELVLRQPSDIASFRDEWSVLLECASPAQDRQKLAGLFPSVDWTRLLMLAEEHGATGHVVSCLHDLEVKVVPPEISQSLADRQRAQIFLAMRLIAELLRILESFASEGIAALVIKGLVLAVRAYANPARRSYGDLDLLVRHRDVRLSTELLVSVGFLLDIFLCDNTSRQYYTNDWIFTHISKC